MWIVVRPANEWFEQSSIVVELRGTRSTTGDSQPARDVCATSGPRHALAGLRTAQRSYCTYGFFAKVTAVQQSLTGGTP